MKLPTALLCSISLATFAGAASATGETHSAECTVVSAQDTVVRQPRADTTARTPTPSRRKAPKRPPRYCPACGMG